MNSYKIFREEKVQVIEAILCSHTIYWLILLLGYVLLSRQEEGNPPMFWPCIWYQQASPNYETNETWPFNATYFSISSHSIWRYIWLKHKESQLERVTLIDSSVWRKLIRRAMAACFDSKMNDIQSLLLFYLRIQSYSLFTSIALRSGGVYCNNVW